MKTYNNLYPKLCSYKNLRLAFKKAGRRKSFMPYVVKFEKDLINNLLQLKKELETLTYKPRPLNRFIVRDPKTRTIHSSNFRDRVVYHALCNILEPIFDKTFIYDSYASRKTKGTLKAVLRFDKFKRKLSKNGRLIENARNNNLIKGYVLKADIKHYFEEVNHEILLNIIKRKIKDNRIIWLIHKILNNFNTKINGKGMPLGNLTSQFFANVYLNELDYFVKHKLKVKYYIRYVDDFIILNSSKEQLFEWKLKINEFLQRNLKLELHQDKSKISSLGNGIAFLGYKIFYHHKLLKKFNRKNIQRKFNNFYNLFSGNKIDYNKIYESMQGFFTYMKNADTFKLRARLAKQIENLFSNEISSIEINRYLKYL